jgi:hypothetical protein
MIRRWLSSDPVILSLAVAAGTLFIVGVLYGVGWRWL